MNRIMICTGVGFVFLGLGVPAVHAQQPASAEPQAPSAILQAPRELVPPLPVPRLVKFAGSFKDCLLYTSPSPRDLSTSRMPSSA